MLSGFVLNLWHATIRGYDNLKAQFQFSIQKFVHILYEHRPSSCPCAHVRDQNKHLYVKKNIQSHLSFIAIIRQHFKILVLASFPRYISNEFHGLILKTFTTNWGCMSACVRNGWMHVHRNIPGLHRDIDKI